MKPVQHYAQLHIAVFLFGCVGLFGKWLLLPAYLIVFGRTLFAALAIWGLLKFKHEQIPAFRVMFLLLGIVLAFHWVAFFRSVQLSTVAIGLLTFSTFPFFTILLESFWLGQALRLHSLIQASLILIGVGLMVMDNQFSGNYLGGISWGVASGASFALLTLLNKRLITQYSSRVVAYYQNLFAMLALLPLAVIFWQPIAVSEWLLLILLGVVFTGLAHTLFIESMQLVSAKTASLVACLEPIYGSIGAFFLLQESPSLWVLLGGLLILAVVVWDALASYEGGC